MSAQRTVRLGVAAAAALCVLTACGTVPPRPPPPTPLPPETAATNVAPTLPTASTRPPRAAVAASDPAPAPEQDVATSADRDAPTAYAVLDRLAAGLDEAGCASPAVRRSMLALQRHPESLSSKFERTLPALDYVLRAIEEKGLPGQFALIPWAESGFRADPGNRGTVQGLWQFTVSTGRGHGLRIDQQFDGRRAAIESTAAAIEHLQRLQTRFLDWRISLLAYNAGEYRVARALKRGQVDASGLPSTLQAHSYAYLHKINALACLFGDIGLRTEWASDTPFDRLQPVRRPVSARSTQQLARAAGIELDELLRYNAAFRNGEVADNAPALILLPGTAATRLLAGVTEPAIGIEVAQAAEINAQASHAAAPVPPTQAMHTVSGGDTLWRIARRYRLALSDLLRWNGLSPRSIIRPGQRLRIRSD